MHSGGSLNTANPSGVTDADPNFDSKDVPQAQCPRCKRWQDDHDGFGVLRCSCGYCSHAAATAGLCDLCGEPIEELDRFRQLQNTFNDEECYGELPERVDPQTGLLT